MVWKMIKWERMRMESEDKESARVRKCDAKDEAEMVGLKFHSPTEYEPIRKRMREPFPPALLMMLSAGKKMKANQPTQSDRCENVSIGCPPEAWVLSIKS